MGFTDCCCDWFALTGRHDVIGASAIGHARGVPIDTSRHVIRESGLQYVSNLKIHSLTYANNKPLVCCMGGGSQNYCVLHQICNSTSV